MPESDLDRARTTDLRTTVAATEARWGQIDFAPTLLARRSIVAATASAAFVRLVWAVGAAEDGDVGPATAYAFTVIFPVVLIGLLLSLGPGRTREGVLMRLGTACQIVLVIAVPPYALHLLLGLPIVFLLVELFETRLPKRLREPIAARLIAC